MHRNILLEASAGTGKTFAIENIVARLLIEAREDVDPITIEKILVVTFTKAATRELKQRVRSTLEKNVAILTNVHGEGSPAGCPDYLLSHIERGSEAVDRAKRLMEQALFSFDRAQIYTIHGFCWKMLKTFALEARISFNAQLCEETSQSEIKLSRGIRDFLHSQLSMPYYSTQQLRILMKLFKKREDKLESELLVEVTKGLEVLPSPSFSDLFTSFQEGIADLSPAITASEIIEDMLIRAQSYTKLHSRDGIIKDSFLNQVKRLASVLSKEVVNEQDFDLLIEDGLFFREAFHPDNLKAKKKSLAPQPLRYPHLLDEGRLWDCVLQACNPAAIFSRVVCDCRTFLQKFREQEELFGHNDLLVEMKRAVAIPAFAAQVQKCFSAAIVDEFQDTDPLQWKIFSALFCVPEWKGFLQLVGDPKQSIYAFRQADIYTYLAAAQQLGAEAHATLDTNYRSLPPLIEALNALFNAAHQLFPLPRHSHAQSLPFRAAIAGKNVECNEACLHFLAAKIEGKATKSAEESCFFPAIVDEMVRLNKEQGIPLGHCAILVADRYQADRLCTYLRECNLPIRPQRGKNLSRSHAVDTMRELLDGILHFQNRSLLYTALGGRVIGMTHQELLLLENGDRLLSILELCHRLRQILREKGFCLFYQEFMKSCWHTGTQCMSQISVLENLLRESGGHEFYREWQDLADLLIGEEYSRHLSPYGLLAFLDDLERLYKTNEEQIMTYVDPYEDGVNILTTYVSKGLEFDVVFALGLTKCTKSSEYRLIPVLENAESVLYPPESDEDPLYIKHCEEIDAEKMRQLYVALTRAKLRLYIPVVIHETSREIQLGSASPIELLLARLDGEADYKEIYRRVGSCDRSGLERLVSEHSSLMTLSTLSGDNKTDSRTFDQSKNIPLNPPPAVQIPLFEEVIQSFTSLTSSKGREEVEMDEGLTITAPHDFQAVEKTPYNLPAGNEVGVLLHKIMETIPFNIVKNYPDARSFVEVIAPFVKRSPFEEWKGVIAGMVFNALRIPLQGSSPAFCLADIKSQSIFREMPFLFPCGSFTEGNHLQSLKPGFLKGVIDLFFEHHGKYYLLDWKSNWLGNDQNHYRVEGLHAAMNQHEYYLQADIYAKAMARYLKLFDDRPFEELFGGTYYLFLRGIGPDTGVLLC